MRFNDTCVLITGGSRGIGKAIAHAFASEGARVGIIFRSNKESAAKTLTELPGSGHHTFQCDISDPAQVHAAVEEAMAKLGRIDVLVNNAAVHEHHPIDKASYAEWQQEWKVTIETNLLGAANMTYCAAQHMIEQKSGRIIFVSSRGAYRGEPEQPAYGASKGATNSFGQSMARALAPYNIGVALVAPGFVETDMVKDILEGERGDGIRAQSPFGRVARPEEVAHAVLHLADPLSLWSSGTVIDVNGASYFR